jgi:drug/metabolite transporter (DMT)-like permease
MMILMANVIFGEKVAAAQWMAAFIGLAGTWLVYPPAFPWDWRLVTAAAARDGVLFCAL